MKIRNTQNSIGNYVGPYIKHTQHPWFWPLQSTMKSESLKFEASKPRALEDLNPKPLDDKTLNS